MAIDKLHSKERWNKHMENKYILAMYDIRAKQDFIFKTNRMKEIVGGSAIIRDCFDDYFYKVASKIGKGIRNDKSVPFKSEDFSKHLADGYIGELVYDGGGNLIVLFKDVATYRDVTYRFTKKVLEDIGTLRVLSSYIEGVDFDDYKSDSERLYKVHSINENKESNIAPWGTLPIVQVDRNTSLPLVTKNNGEKVSKESHMKLIKYAEETEKDSEDGGVKELDSLVTKKGEESILAIVYIDGNNMGAQVQSCIKNVKSYDDCVKNLREFSYDIQQNYIEDRKKDIRKYLADKKKPNEWRLIVGAGDEINFICNARDAFALTEAYLKSLPKDCSSCAGIAIFHSHAPYSDVYRIAEECCESGKTLMKQRGITSGCFVDYHYCQGAIDVSLEKIRENEANQSISRPWFVPTENSNKVDGDITTLDDVNTMLGFLRELGRTNVKGLLAPAKSDLAALKLDLNRIYSHMSDSKKQKIKKTGINIGALNEKQQNLIYDIIITYDLWFRGEE